MRRDTREEFRIASNLGCEDANMPKTKWLSNALAPFHHGLYEVKTSDGNAAVVLFSEDGWDTDVPFEKWRGLDRSLAKKELARLKRVVNESKGAETNKAKRIAADAAVRIARHYFGREYNDAPNKKRKLLGSESRKFFELANELVALDAVERQAFQYLLEHPSMEANEYMQKDVSSSAAGIPPPVPDEL